MFFFSWCYFSILFSFFLGILIITKFYSFSDKPSNKTKLFPFYLIFFLVSCLFLSLLSKTLVSCKCYNYNNNISYYLVFIYFYYYYLFLLQDTTTTSKSSKRVYVKVVEVKKCIIPFKVTQKTILCSMWILFFIHVFVFFLLSSF